jgi:2-polyprenyl-6-hydroxyphenyl methylase/3-demethylubiquinone-9 3-methyltransferase
MSYDMLIQNDISGYRYADAKLNCSHSYILPAVFKILAALEVERSQRRIFELGCGNGSVAYQLTQKGYDITGVDPSMEGIEQARRAYPGLKLFHGSAYDDLVKRFGEFPVVISLEVIEHVYFPRKFADCVYSLLSPGGTAIISTPYHGYWKNLAMAITARMDPHFTALWDNGHIKFWSVKTLSQLLREVGFGSIKFCRVGRIPCLAKAMIAIATK